MNAGVDLMLLILCLLTNHMIEWTVATCASIHPSNHLSVSRVLLVCSASGHCISNTKRHTTHNQAVLCLCVLAEAVLVHAGSTSQSAFLHNMHKQLHSHNNVHTMQFR